MQTRNQLGFPPLRAILLLAGIAVACSTGNPGNPMGPDTVSVPDTFTINGQVVDGALQPLDHVPVLVAGHAQVITDANGRFSVSGVTKPYDVATALSAPPLGVLYTGLTRADPVVTVPITSLVTSQMRSAGISGTVSGGAGYPLANYQRTDLLFASPEVTTGSAADAHSGAYAMQLSWRGPSATTGTIRALQVQIDSTSRLPASYLGYGTKTGATVANGGSLTGQDIQVTAVTTMTVSGTVTLPNGYTIFTRRVRAGFGPAPTAPPLWNVLTDRDTASAFSYAAPDLPGAALTVEITARSTGTFASATAWKQVTSANATSLSVTLIAPPGPAAPAEGATGITTGSRLSWTPVSGAIYTVSILDQTTTSNPSHFLLVTADTAAVIPDLSSLGLPLVAGAKYGWAVSSISPFASLDEVTSSTGFFAPSDGRSGFSTERHFTTPP